MTYLPNKKYQILRYGHGEQCSEVMLGQDVQPTLDRLETEAQKAIDDGWTQHSPVFTVRKSTKKIGGW